MWDSRATTSGNHMWKTVAKQMGRQLGDKVPRFPQLRDLTETLRMHLEKNPDTAPNFKKLEPAGRQNLTHWETRWERQ